MYRGGQRVGIRKQYDMYENVSVKLSLSETLLANRVSEDESGRMSLITVHTPKLTLCKLSTLPEAT